MEIHGLLSFAVLAGVLAVILKFCGLCFIPKAKFSYQKEIFLFSLAERSFLGVLELVLGNQFRVFGKVRLADVVKVKSGLIGRDWGQAFNRIKGKHLDFVVCDSSKLSIQLVIELDDSSHYRFDRQGRDKFVDEVLLGAGVPIVRFPVKRSYSVEEIRQKLLQSGV